jgi:hypothetical protein
MTGSDKAMIISEQNLAWLLEDDEPSVQYRTLTELLDLGAEDARVRRALGRIPDSAAVDLLFSAMAPDGSWRYAYRDQINRYLKYLSATLSYAAEIGLGAEDERVTKAVHHLFGMQQLDGDFHRHYSCYNGLLLRALNRLGFAEAGETCRLRQLVRQSIRHDGGYHCDLRPKRGRGASPPHKSCIKGSLKSLLAFSEDVELSQTEECERLANYFLRRHLLFRNDDPATPVTRELLRLSFPFTYHPGLTEPLYALAKLGHGDRPELKEAWAILLSRADSDCRLPLERSLNWPHVGCGIRGRPSKWLTLYAGIIEKRRHEHSPSQAK